MASTKSLYRIYVLLLGPAFSKSAEPRPGASSLGAARGKNLAARRPANEPILKGPR